MEIWKSIVGYEKIYEVSNKGQVRSLNRTITNNNGKVLNLKGKVLNLNDNGKGYLWVYLSDKNIKTFYYVHRLIAKTFLKNNNNYPEVNHKDGDKSNNNVDNLEWCTRLQNIRHSESNGFRIPKGAKGINNGKSKLTIQQVIDIFNMYKTKSVTQKEISILFNIERSTVSSIVRGKTWKHLNLK